MLSIMAEEKELSSSWKMRVESSARRQSGSLASIAAPSFWFRITTCFFCWRIWSWFSSSWSVNYSFISCGNSTILLIAGESLNKWVKIFFFICISVLSIFKILTIGLGLGSGYLSKISHVKWFNRIFCGPDMESKMYMTQLPSPPGTTWLTTLIKCHWFGLQLATQLLWTRPFTLNP